MAETVAKCAPEGVQVRVSIERHTRTHLEVCTANPQERAVQKLIELNCANNQ